MNELSIEQLTDWHELNKEKNLFGRRIVFEMIEPIIKNLSSIYHRPTWSFIQPNTNL